jgi:hypothetical protein
MIGKGSSIQHNQWNDIGHQADILNFQYTENGGFPASHYFDNYFQLNEIVYKTDTKDHLNRYLFKSLERNFSAFIYEIQTTPHSPAKNETLRND